MAVPKHPPFKQGGHTYVWNPVTKGYSPTDTPNAGAQAVDAANNIAARNRRGPAATPVKQSTYGAPKGGMPVQGQIPGLGSPGPHPIVNNVMQLQKFLVSKGFPIHADGMMGPATSSALQYYRQNQSVKGWTPPHDATVVTVHPGGKVTRGGTVGSSVPHDARSTAGAGTGGAAPNSKLPGLPSPNVGSLIPESLANSGAQPYDTALAGKMAGLQFDPQINEAKLAKRRAPIDAEQHMKDIGTWYDTVQKSLKVARERNQGAATTAANTIGSTTKDILSSIGGAANQGTGTLAAQGASDAAMQAQLGQNEQSYQNDLGTLLQNEAAGQKTNQMNKDSKTSQDILQQLQNLQGQRGSAQASSLFQIQQANNTIADQHLQQILGIKNSNNSILQQRYSNALSAQTAAIAAAMNAAQVGYYNSAAKATSGASGGFTPWAKMNAAQKQQIIQAAIQQGSDSTGAALPNAKSIIGNYMAGQGFTSYGQNNPAGNQMGSLINAALAHAQAILQQRQAAASAAGTTYNGG